MKEAVCFVLLMAAIIAIIAVVVSETNADIAERRARLDRRIEECRRPEFMQAVDHTGDGAPRTGFIYRCDDGSVIETPWPL